MSTALRSVFDGIRSDQRQIRALVAELDRRIDLVGKRLDQEVSREARNDTALLHPPPLPAMRASIPPVSASAPAEPAVSPACPSTPLPSPDLAAAQTTPEPRQPEAFSDAAAAAVPSSQVARRVPPIPAVPNAKPADSWELAFGTVWLARIGIVILITGLVFLGNYAWQHIVTQLGAGGKLALLYLSGAALAGAGVWLDRGRQNLRSYGRVLLAGGAATIYYATYAAHYVERLRVIESPLLGGTLLLLLAAALITWAYRRGSQVVALLTILLAYYTSAINPIGTFTLFSSLLLTGAAVFFIVSRCWSALGWFSLAGTYGSYAYWHYFVEAGARSVPGAANLWILGSCFLAGYWLLFTAAVFAGDGKGLADQNPTLLTTANNGAFFSLAGLQIAQQQPSSFWSFALFFGAALLGLAAMARVRRNDIAALDGAYLAHGLGLVTLGLISKLAGYQLALVLAVESAFLLTSAGRRHGWIYQIAATLVAAGACGIAYDRAAQAEAVTLLPTICIAAVLFGDAWWLKQRLGKLEPLVWSWRSAAFVTLGLVLTVRLLQLHMDSGWLPGALAGVALLATFGFPKARLPELLLSQFLLGWGVALVATATALERPIPLSCAGLLLAALLVLEQWWKRQRLLVVDNEARVILQLFVALGAMIVIFHMCEPLRLDVRMMLLTSGVALATLVYGTVTQAWATAITGQLFTLLAVRSFAIALLTQGTQQGAAIAPVVELALTGLIIEYFAIPRLGSRALAWLDLKRVAAGYRITATLALALWALRYVPEAWLAPFFVTVGALTIASAVVLQNRWQARVGLAFQVIALAICWFRIGSVAESQEFVAIAAVPATLRIARRFSCPAVDDDFRRWITGGATATAWLWVTRWTIAHHGTEGLTIAWSAFALITFAAGLTLRDRVYRTGGFAILALAVARVFLVDVWRLETLYRILSFLVLGGVLLVLGFVYNKYAEQIRKWL